MGTYLFAVFMLLVVFATLTSAFSMLGNCHRRNHPQDEKKAQQPCLGNRYCDFVVGIPSALSFGVERV